MVKKYLAQRPARGQIARDDKELGVGLAAAAAGIVLGGALTRDGLFALTAMISGFDGALQELGKSKWVVSLEGDLLVVPKNRVIAGRT